MCSSQQLTSTQVNSHILILTWLRYSHSSIQRSIKLHTCTTTGWSTVVRAQLYTLLTHCRFRQVKVVSRITCLHSSWLYYNRIWASVLEQLPMADNIELRRVTKVIASNTVEEFLSTTNSFHREGRSTLEGSVLSLPVKDFWIQHEASSVLHYVNQDLQSIFTGW